MRRGPPRFSNLDTGFVLVHIQTSMNLVCFTIPTHGMLKRTKVLRTEFFYFFGERRKRGRGGGGEKQGKRW